MHIDRLKSLDMDKDIGIDIQLEFRNLSFDLGGLMVLGVDFNSLVRHSFFFF